MDFFRFRNEFPTKEPPDINRMYQQQQHQHNGDDKSSSNCSIYRMHAYRCILDWYVHSWRYALYTPKVPKRWALASFLWYPHHSSSFIRATARIIEARYGLRRWCKFYCANTRPRRHFLSNDNVLPDKRQTHKACVSSIYICMHIYM